MVASLAAHTESGRIGLVDVEAKVFAMIAPGEAQYSEVCILRLIDFRLTAAIAENLGTWLKSLSVSGSRVLRNGPPPEMVERLEKSHEPVAWLLHLDGGGPGRVDLDFHQRQPLGPQTDSGRHAVGGATGGPQDQHA